MRHPILADRLPKGFLLRMASQAPPWMARRLASAVASELDAGRGIPQPHQLARMAGVNASAARAFIRQLMRDLEKQAKGTVE